MQAGKTLLQSIWWRGLYYVAAFIINLLIVRHFQASVSGAVYYISSIYALVLLFSSLSLESGIIYFAAKGGIEVSRLFSFSVVWSLFIGLLTFIIVYFFLQDAYLDMSPTLLLVSAVCFICGNLLTTYCSGLFYANNNFMVPNCINIVITVILIIILPFNNRSIIPAVNNENYFYVYFISFFVQGLCIAIAARLKYVKNSVSHFISLAEFKLLFGYCAMAFSGNIIHFLLYRIDYWFVEKYCLPEELGNYIQVSKLGQLFFILPTILASVVFPVTASGRQTSIINLLTLLSRVIFMAYLLACLFLLITGRWLFPYLFGSSFGDMYEPFVFLIPGILGLSGIFTITAYFAGKNRIRFNIIGSLLALATILAGDIIFIPRYGIAAAAGVSSVGYIVYQVYVLVIINKEFKTTVNDFFFFRLSDLQTITNLLLNRVNKSNDKTVT